MTTKADRTAKLLTNTFEVGDRIRCNCPELGGKCGLSDGPCHGVVARIVDGVPSVRWDDTPTCIERVSAAETFLVLLEDSA